MTRQAATPSQQANHLIGETSPYLQQHACNPVEWYPWGEEALTRAREEDKPILLSIGYSACHWCHVMAHESFEDPTTAEVMNRLFINIKVDREERPDLDRIYQTAHQLLTRRPGGWPLTMVLTPDQLPFVGGTYFPPEERFGLPAFRDVLQRIHDFYTQNRASIQEQNHSLVAALESGFGDSVGKLDDKPVRLAVQELAGSFDEVHGGFGSAPKFPHVANLALLLRDDDPQARQMALFTLQSMAAGGLLDQLGGGFYRYSVDERWEIPHFEKMLYDNGPLLQRYVEAWQLTGDSFYNRAAEKTAEWVLREMQLEHGGYAASQDADTDGEEGGFYVWTQADMQALLTNEEYAVTSRYYGLDRPANFEGRWHLKLSTSPADIATSLGRSEDEVLQRLRSAREKLFELRNGRAELGRDDKVLVSWNALMIKGMACAGTHLGHPEFVASAERALDFIRREMFRDGRLLASWKDGQGKYAAYLDDYAFLLEALLALLQARWRPEDLLFAQQLADVLLEHFEDEQNGGFFFTADDHETLIQRPRSMMDESMPSGNGVAAAALYRLGHLSGRLEYLDAAEKTLRAGFSLMNQYPTAHGAMLCALQEQQRGIELFVLRGKVSVLGAWKEKLLAGFHPNRYVIILPPEAGGLPEALQDKPAQGEAVAYRCLGHQCSPPIRNMEDLPD
jgi:uncharacterized protein YyaL (SSP411 family)